MKAMFASADIGLIGLIFFFVFFGIVLLWTFRPGSKKDYDKDALIPLEEED